MLGAGSTTTSTTSSVTAIWIISLKEEDEGQLVEGAQEAMATVMTTLPPPTMTTDTRTTTAQQQYQQKSVWSVGEIVLDVGPRNGPLEKKRRNGRTADRENCPPREWCLLLSLLPLVAPSSSNANGSKRRKGSSTRPSKSILLWQMTMVKTMTVMTVMMAA